MIECCDILNCIDEILYEVIDEDNNILYPKNENDIKRFEKLIKTYSSGSLINEQNTDKWYKYHKKEINKDGHKYTLRYLIDITEHKKDEEKYQIDSLTSVLSRPTILEKLLEEIKDCINNNISLSVIIGDIDFFKKINDTYGHVAGDLVLKRIGDIFLKHTGDDTQSVGRYGGEEFLFILKNVSFNDTVNKIKEIKSSLDELSITFKKDIIENITMSFGVYYVNNFDKEEADKFSKQKIISEIINLADMALYESKNTGRNKTHVYYENGIIEEVSY